jgi:hypothetical protein
VKQGMIIESKDASNRVLLYLHGGMPDYFLSKKYPTRPGGLFHRRLVGAARLWAVLQPAYPPAIDHNRSTHRRHIRRNRLFAPAIRQGKDLPDGPLGRDIFRDSSRGAGAGPLPCLHWRGTDDKSAQVRAVCLRLYARPVPGHGRSRHGAKAGGGAGHDCRHSASLSRSTRRGDAPAGHRHDA